MSFLVSKQWLNKKDIRLIVWLSLLLLRWKCLETYLRKQAKPLQVWNLSSKTMQLWNQPQWSCRDSVRSAPRFKLNSTLNNCSLNRKIHGCIIPRAIALANCPPKCLNTQYFVHLDPCTAYTRKGLAGMLLSYGLMTWSGVTLDAQKTDQQGPTKATHHLSLTSFRAKINPWNHQRMRPASLKSLSPRETSCQEAKGFRASGMSEATAQQHHEASSSCTARWRVHPRDLYNWSTDESLKCINDQQMITCFTCSTISTCFNVARKARRRQKSWIQGSKARLMKSPV